MSVPQKGQILYKEKKQKKPRKLPKVAKSVEVPLYSPNNLTIAESAVARRPFCCMQVAAQTQHQVTLVDVSEDILTKAGERIKTSLSRVAKKKFGEDPKVRKWNIGWECGYMEVILLVT